MNPNNMSIGTFNIGGANDWEKIHEKKQIEKSQNITDVSASPAVSEFNLKETQGKLVDTLKLLTEKCPIVCLQEVHTDEALAVLDKLKKEKPNLEIVIPSTWGQTAIIYDTSKFDKTGLEKIDKNTFVVQLTPKTSDQVEAKAVLVSSAWLPAANPFQPDKESIAVNKKILTKITTKMEEMDKKGNDLRFIGMDSNLTYKDLHGQTADSFKPLEEKGFSTPKDNPATVYNFFIDKQQRKAKCCQLKIEIIEYGNKMFVTDNHKTIIKNKKIELEKEIEYLKKVHDLDYSPEINNIKTLKDVNKLVESENFDLAQYDVTTKYDTKTGKYANLSVIEEKTKHQADIIFANKAEFVETVDHEFAENPSDHAPLIQRFDISYHEKPSNESIINKVQNDLTSKTEMMVATHTNLQEAHEIQNQVLEKTKKTESEKNSTSIIIPSDVNQALKIVSLGRREKFWSQFKALLTGKQPPTAMDKSEAKTKILEFFKDKNSVNFINSLNNKSSSKDLKTGQKMMSFAKKISKEEPDNEEAKKMLDVCRNKGKEMYLQTLVEMGFIKGSS